MPRVARRPDGTPRQIANSIGDVDTSSISGVSSIASKAAADEDAVTSSVSDPSPCSKDVDSLEKVKPLPAMKGATTNQCSSDQ